MIWLFCYILAVREQRRRHLSALRDKLYEDVENAVQRLREGHDAFLVRLERSLREQQEQLHDEFRQFLEAQFSEACGDPTRCR